MVCWDNVCQFYIQSQTQNIPTIDCDHYCGNNRLFTITFYTHLSLITVLLAAVASLYSTSLFGVFSKDKTFLAKPYKLCQFVLKMPRKHLLSAVGSRISKSFIS